MSSDSPDLSTSPADSLTSADMHRTESMMSKEPILHTCFFDDPPQPITVDVDSSNDRLLGPYPYYSRAGFSEQRQPRRRVQQKQPAVNETECTTTECEAANELLDTLQYKGLHGVTSHTELAKTAYGVRILAKKLDTAKICLQTNSVMIVTKARDNSLVYLTREIAEWLLKQSAMTTVYVDHNLEHSRRFDPERIAADVSNGKARIRYWTEQLIQESPSLFDFVITLGGDGTVLYVSTLFQKAVPPILSFSLGSLGFLTNFPFEEYKETLTSAFHNGVTTNLRMRFTCRVHNEKGELVTEQQVLNELTVDRGPSPWVTMLELYGDGNLITVAQSDGLIIATPTGSTAYSLSAGGSLVYPSVNAICVTPICAHTLSFRPILLPDSMFLKIKVPLRARSHAWASFDGRERVELHKGYYVTVSASRYPFPTIRSSKTEYFDSVSSVLGWNKRKEQKSFAHVLSDKNRKSYDEYEDSDESRYEIDYKDGDMSEPPRVEKE